ncbi:hypothetical protein F5ESL0233_00560 [Lactobacillus sp. ESL0233]|uniref:hypothetical protein n=1 Tax=Lactobacillus sp. ESL0233 TaxID=2069354 RepID=UPI000EFD4724|nr:hypothetical protein [Lactobacillus sp. ESL0233]RMC42718.1 hypothetical protein F5ESL0233_00560 [Lactobacillus sp. ESL0233]
MNSHDEQEDGIVLTRGAKTALTKKLAKKLLEAVGKRITNKDLKDVLIFLTSWDDDLQAAATNWLVTKYHWNKDVAYWTVKSILFVLL